MPPKYFDFRMISLWAIFAIIMTIMIKIGSKNTLDSRLFYSGAEATQYLSSLNDRDVYRYLVTEFFDMSFIVTYASTLYLTLKRVFFINQKIKYLAFFPAAFDFVETQSIILFLTNGTNFSSSIKWLGYVTLFKWISLVLLTLVIMKKIAKSIFQKKL